MCVLQRTAKIEVSQLIVLFSFKFISVEGCEQAPLGRGRRKGRARAGGSNDGRGTDAHNSKQVHLLIPFYSTVNFG